MSAYHPYFFTATILNWYKLLENKKYIAIILNSLTFLVNDKRIKLYAYVIMPNHIHLIWQPVNNNHPQDIQRDFLKFTAQNILYDLRNNNQQDILNNLLVNKKDRKHQIWKRGALSIELYSEHIFIQKMDYIHHNPVQGKWQLAEHPEDYEYSSAAYYEKGIDKLNILTHYRE